MSVKSGITAFLKAKGEVEVYFPNNDIKCVYCPYLSSNDRLCQLNKKPTFSPSKYVGEWCPLQFENAEVVEGVES